MTRRSRHEIPQQQGAPTTPETELALARENFLTGDRVPDAIRRTIAASWQRSAQWNVTGDQLAAPYHGDLDTDGRLVHASTAVLDQLREQLSDQPVSVVLTNPEGYVLARRTGSRGLEHYLDEVSLAPGFSYAEQFVGTNGIGTALESGQATYVYQREHYTEPLGDLACAGVPLRNPTTRQVEGLLDITCWAEHANPLLMAMANSAAQSIEATLFAHVRGRETTLLNEYLQTSRRCLDPVLAFNGSVFMLNDKARQLLSSQDQTAVSEYLREELDTPAKRLSAELALPSGTYCRVHFKQVHHGNRYAGTLARVQLVDSPQRFDVPELRDAPSLPGIAGSGALWKQACRKLDRDFLEGNWTVLEGEAGVGKLALIQSVHLHRAPETRLRVFDAADSAPDRNWVQDVRHELAVGAGTIVLRHLDQLGPQVLKRLNTTLREHAGDNPSTWIAATLNRDLGDLPELDELLTAFPRSVEVPPLRHHLEDIEEIAPLMLRRITKRSDVRFSSAAMRTLLRRSWAGNVTDLQRTIQSAVRRSRAEVIELDDLPPECHSHNRRILTPLESMERDAIVNALAESGHNRAQAARSLGISRATIYRKINEYGIACAPASK
ncbi:transcriptional regulator of acetoin/glycerol metabolism [Saccharopolyspora lacisalsi]|uniref:Transcriptional regulator of acetoin/glycerol metabolism n=1 Tax=Halosaccharopolyspora lacisalsi TaxID=1000566 RepID=A0A839DZD9_9PSEU|nr:helix-turn-helix domain-containing protein [Halosaccharopolyspora lacisalsi]MBA8826069.1 transcriptional regulator of acetoin/glycerol metabolism [Halosaccharopolyspora lacisalsi]